MNILYAHQRFGDQGGAELNVRDTAEALRARGHRCGIVYRENTGKNEGTWEGIFEGRVRAAKNLEGAAARRAIADFDPDVIYINNESHLGVLEEIRDSGRAIVRTVHDHNLYCLRGYRYNYFTRRICTRPLGFRCITHCMGCLTRQGLSFRSYLEKQKELQITRGYDHLVAVSGYIRDQLVLNGCNPSRISVVHPVPHVAELPQPPEFSDRNIILCPAQILRGKGIDFLIRALAYVDEPYECLILGDGRHRGSCESLARKLRLGDRVKFLGYVPHDQVAKYFTASSVVAVPSVWAEPCALVGVEAITLGLPVVAFDVGGNRDWLHDGVNGFLVPAMDSRAFAEKLQVLLRDKALGATMGKRGQTLAAQEFNFEAQITKLEEVLIRAARQRNTLAKMSYAI